MGAEGREEEDEESRQDIGFFEGIDFVGAISERLQERATRKKHSRRDA